jgi:hypothetical protein
MTRFRPQGVTSLIIGALIIIQEIVHPSPYGTRVTSWFMLCSGALMIISGLMLLLGSRTKSADANRSHGAIK